MKGKKGASKKDEKYSYGDAGRFVCDTEQEKSRGQNKT